MPDTRRRQRRSKAVSRSHTATRGQPIARGRPAAEGRVRRGRFARSPVLFGGAALAIAAVAAGVWFATMRGGPSPATPAGATPVALPDFGQIAADNAADTAPVDLATPTAGVAGPT